MSALFASGHAVDLVLAVLLLEAIVLIVRGRATMLIALLPGVFILLGLRAALTQAGWPWVAAALAASFPAHLADLYRRRDERSAADLK